MIGFELGPSAVALRGSGAPPLLLDFVENRFQNNGEITATFPELSGVAFSRSGAATAFTRAGGVTGFAAGAPRITDRGLLLEGAATNGLVRSQTLENASWIKSAITVTANPSLAPDGTTSADRIADTATTADHRANQNIAATVAQAYTASVFVKDDGRRYAGLQLLAYGGTDGGGVAGVWDLQAGVNTRADGYGGKPAPAHSITALADGWYLVTLTIVVTGSLTHLSLRFILSNDGQASTYLGDGSGVFAWQADLQAGTGSSPIATDAASATRGADAASVVVPAQAATYEAVYGEANTVVVGAVTAGASFDLVTGRPWIGLGNELKRLTMR